jgi:hypothetical protein
LWAGSPTPLPSLHLLAQPNRAQPVLPPRRLRPGEEAAGGTAEATRCHRLAPVGRDRSRRPSPAIRRSPPPPGTLVPSPLSLSLALFFFAGALLVSPRSGRTPPRALPLAVAPPLAGLCQCLGADRAGRCPADQASLAGLRGPGPSVSHKGSS